MKYILSIFTIILFTSNCQEAVFNNLAEGAGGLLIGIRIASNPPSIVITDLPQNVDEGSSRLIKLRFSNIVENESISITSTNSKLIFSENPVLFNSSNSTIDKEVIMTALEDADSLDDEEVVTFSSLNHGSLNATVVIKDLLTRGINLSIPRESIEESTYQIDVSLRIQPPESEVMLVLNPNDPALQLEKTILRFTRENFRISQKVNYSINDIFNDNREYTVTASIDSESVVKSTTIIDNDFFATDLSTQVGESFNSGLNPSIAIMNSNPPMFFVAVKDNSNAGRLGIYKCENLNGSNCSTMNKALLPLAFTNGSRPKLSIDPDMGNPTSELLFITTTSIQNGDKTVSWKFDKDMNLISHSGTVSDPYLKITNDLATIMPVSNPYPVSIIHNNQLVNLYNNGLGQTYLQSLSPSLVPSSTPSTFDCYGLQNFAIGSRGFFHNSIDGYYYNALSIGADNIFVDFCNFHDFTPISALYYPAIQKIDPSGSIIDRIEFDKHLSGLTPDLGIDTINNKLILLTANYGMGGIPYIFRCPLNVTTLTTTSCTEHDISSGIASSTYFPKLNVDLENQKILVISYNSDILNLHHCNLDASNCKVTSISGVHPLLTSSDEHNFDSVIDTLNKRLLVVFTNKNTGKLIFTRFGLGGF